MPMQMIDAKTFAKTLAPLASVFGNPVADMNDEQTRAFWDVYRMAVGHLDKDTLAAAVLHVVQTHEYPTFPKPAVLLAAALSIRGQGSRTGLEAWGDVELALRQHGDYHPPRGYVGHALRLSRTRYEWEFSDPLILPIVNAIGWSVLCRADDLSNYQARFIRAYEAKQTSAAEAGLYPALSAPAERPGPFRQLAAPELPQIEAPAAEAVDAAALLAGLGDKLDATTRHGQRRAQLRERETR